MSVLETIKLYQIPIIVVSIFVVVTILSCIPKWTKKNKKMDQNTINLVASLLEKIKTLYVHADNLAENNKKEEANKIYSEILAYCKTIQQQIFPTVSPPELKKILNFDIRELVDMIHDNQSKL